MARPGRPQDRPGPVTSARQLPCARDPAMVATARRPGDRPGRGVLRDELGAMDRACSRFRAGSEISRLDRARGRPVLVSPLLAEAVAAALWRPR